MVPYDQPEAALVSHSCPSECTRMSTYSNCPGYDYPVGEEHPSDGLILCILFHTWFRAPKLEATFCRSCHRIIIDLSL